MFEFQTKFGGKSFFLVCKYCKEHMNNRKSQFYWKLRVVVGSIITMIMFHNELGSIVNYICIRYFMNRRSYGDEYGLLWSK